MSDDLCREILGVPESSEPRVLLGLGPGTPDAPRVEAALRARLARVIQHSRGRTPEADRLRVLLRRAAATLLARGRPTPVPRRPRRVATLTDFDRHVLAVLVASGGWNARCRARLVSLAAAYGVSVQGLVKVIAGLSEYARAGGPRLGVAEITAGGGRVSAPPGRPVAEEADLQWAARLVPELQDRGPGSTIKLAALFGLLTLLVGVLAARILFAPAPVPEPASPGPAAGAVAATPRRAPVPPPVAETPAAPARVLASYPQRPTFQGRTLTADAARAADECPRLGPELESIARRITVSDTPAEAVYRNWDECLGTVASGWVLIDDTLRESIERRMFEALYAASDAPSVSDRLLAPLRPPGRLLGPEDVWRGAWTAGVLARIHEATRLPPAAVQRAGRQLEEALGPATPAEAGFAAAARVWLDAGAGTLAGVTEYSEQVYDLWEFWIAAQRRLGRGPAFDASIMGAIDAVLATSADLSRPGPGVNVLGRLLELADFESSPTVRERFATLLADQQRIGSRDLWVLTSLLAQSRIVSWYGEDLVLPQDADWIFRRRLADRIAARWPESAYERATPAAAVRGIPIEPDVAARWIALYEAQEAEPLDKEPRGLLDQLYRACRLNEAAVRFAYDLRPGEAAGNLLEEMEAGGPSATPAPASPPPPAPRPKGLGFQQQPREVPGQPIGADGEWAVAFEEAGRSTEDRLRLLDALRQRAGTDLGPIDAEMFVRQVYRGAPSDVRQLAQTIAAEQFARGPNVVQELVDQLPAAPASAGTAEMIRGVTNRLLPASHTGSWAAEARLALVSHALELLGSPGLAVDRWMEAIRDVYDARRASLEPAPSPAASATPREAVERVGEAWRERAAAASEAWSAAVRPLPGELRVLRHRHATRDRLAEGPLQRFVAAQLQVMELMAYVTVAEQPGVRDDVADVLADSARRRRDASHVLAQAVEVERAMSRLWRLLVVVAAGDGEDRS